MNVFFRFLFLGCFSLSVFSFQSFEAVPGEYLVKVKNGMKASFVFSETVSSDQSWKLLKLNENKAIDQKASLSTLLEIFKNDPAVELAEPNYIYRLIEPVDMSPAITSSFAAKESPVEPIFPVNDPLFSDLWVMPQIDALKAWLIRRSAPDIVVAVIDTGIDYGHEDLAENIWFEEVEGEKKYGFNAITGELDGMDDHNHGTHCAGSIGAVGDNQIGVVGVAWNVEMMPVKFLSASGSGTTADAIKSIDWAVEKGANILSNSWGGGAYSEALKESIERSRDAGVLFIAAVGNSSQDMDSSPSYPASYDIENVINVASISEGAYLSYFSNFGKHEVDIVAPGEDVLSTIPTNKYKKYSGTSMATPHVAGAAALYWAGNLSLTATDVRSALITSATKNSSLLINKVANGGASLNVFNLLSGIDVPGPVTVPDEEWSEEIPLIIESEHPYLANQNKEWILEHEGAKYLKIHMASFHTEKKYDYLKFLDRDGNELQRLTGLQEDDLWTYQLKTSYVKIVFVSDHSVQKNGFFIDSYRWSDFD